MFCVFIWLPVNHGHFNRLPNRESGQIFTVHDIPLLQDRIIDAEAPNSNSFKELVMCLALKSHLNHHLFPPSQIPGMPFLPWQKATHPI